MNRRDFWMSAGSAAALSLLGGSVSTLLARETTPTIPLFVKGLAMVDFSNSQYLRIALPEAPHHTATLQLTTTAGIVGSHPLRGSGRLRYAPSQGVRPEVRVPQLVDVQELYPGARPRLEDSPTMISIPWAAVSAIGAETLSEDRWTFVFKDTGEEVITFRPRKVAESLRFDLVSSGVLEMNGGQLLVDLGQVSDVSTEFVPTTDDMGGYSDHFAFYLPYVDIGADAPEVQPKPVGRARRPPSPMLTMGHAFAGSARVWPYTVCFPFRVG